MTKSAIHLSDDVSNFYDNQGRHMSATHPREWSDLFAQRFDEIDPETGEIYYEQQSKTQQQFADESDINAIVKRARVTGLLPTGERAYQYGDFTNIPDYHAAQNAIAYANNAFGRLPSEIRELFKNDPSKLIDFLSDPKNHDEAVRLGILGASSSESINNAEEKAPLGEAQKPPAPPAGKTTKGAPKPEILEE